MGRETNERETMTRLTKNCAGFTRRDFIQLGLGGFASRQTVTAGNSVHLAARAVREKAISAAARLLDVP